MTSILPLSKQEIKNFAERYISLKFYRLSLIELVDKLRELESIWTFNPDSELSDLNFELYIACNNYVNLKITHLVGKREVSEYILTFENPRLGSVVFQTISITSIINTYKEYRRFSNVSCNLKFGDQFLIKDNIFNSSEIAQLFE